MSHLHHYLFAAGLFVVCTLASCSDSEPGPGSDQPPGTSAEPEGHAESHHEGEGGGQTATPASATPAAPDGAAGATAPPSHPEAATPAPTLPVLTDAVPSSISPTRAPANVGADPAADYVGLDAVMANQDGAVGRTVMVHGYISRLAPAGTPVTVSDCEAEGSTSTFEATFTESLADLVRGTPNRSTGYGTVCPRILLHISGFTSSGRPMGEIQAIYDVSPDPPPTGLPSGVDFVSMDDALLQGAAAVGRTVDVYAYRGHTEERAGESYLVLYTQNCSAHGGNNAHFLVPMTPANEGQLMAIPRGDLDPRGCQRVRVRLSAAPVATRYGFEGEVIGIGERTEDMPRANP